MPGCYSIATVRARTILLVDDDHAFRARVREALGGVYRLQEVSDAEGFRLEFQPHRFDLVILDLRLREGREGLDLLREIRDHDELQPVIMVSAYGDTETTLDAVASGALMFLHKKEFTPELLARMVEAVLRQGQLQRRAASLEERLRLKEPAELVGVSPAAQEAARFARRAADEPDALVVVAGEPGSGRELMARVIHSQSRRRAREPFFSLDVRSLGPDGLAAALFGIPASGAPQKRGALALADGGVLFLEDGPPLPAAVAHRLWRVTGQGVVESRNGVVPVNVQVILGPRTTGEARSVAGLPAGKVLEIYLPPLRERREEIPLLAAYFLQRFRMAGKTTARAVSPQALRILEAHRWPGNVQELRNAVEFGAIQAQVAGDDELRSEYLPSNLVRPSGAGETWDYRVHLARSEVWLTDRAIVEKALDSKTALAEVLGYDRFTFLRRLRRRLEEFPELKREFPRVARMFSS
jgi:DNA-binding NtrC family response regulator